ncbi:MAG: hypothetical protein WD030_09460 [Pirellulales bacterium]
MSNQMRWRYGDTSPVVFQVASATVIEIGDLLYVDDDEVKPAGDQEDQASPAGNQELFHDSFAGVAMQQSPAGEAEPIRVATRGVFEFDASTGAYEIGDFLGPDENVAGDALENQKVTDVAGPNLAVGRCVRRPASVANSVLVEIVSTVVHGGPQGPE